MEFVEFPYSFDGSILAEQTGMPLKIHPSVPTYESYKQARFRLYPDGEIIARFNYEMGVVVPLDEGLRRVMTVT